MGGSPLTPDTGHRRILFVSPDPAVAQEAVRAAARRLELDPDFSRLKFAPLHFWALLRAYRDAAATFSTHVLLPGTDPSGSRIHVHLTHGSGPKPDTTFRGPTTVLASITPQWVPSQLREYKLPPQTPVVQAMPRLEIMRRAAGDRMVLTRMGLDAERPVLVWAPTYRAIERPGGEIRVSGTRFGPSSRSVSLSDGAGPEQLADATAPLTVDTVRDITQSMGWACIAKPHPRDADNLRGLGLSVFTNDDLRRCGVTAYELFGVADLLITDYSSVFTERAALRLPFKLWCPDYESFVHSYRGFREFTLETLTDESRLLSWAHLTDALVALSENQ